MYLSYYGETKLLKIEVTEKKRIPHLLVVPKKEDNHSPKTFPLLEFLNRVRTVNTYYVIFKRTKKKLWEEKNLITSIILQYMLLLIRTSKFSILNIEVGSLTDVFQHHLDHVVLVPFPHTFGGSSCRRVRRSRSSCSRSNIIVLYVVLSAGLRVCWGMCDWHQVSFHWWGWWRSHQQGLLLHFSQLGSLWSLWLSEK